MKRVFFWVAVLSAATFLASSCCNSGHKVTVKNSTDLDRTYETVEIDLAGFTDVTPENAVILDKTGAQVPVQVYTDNNGITKLLFQASVPARSEEAFTLTAGEREAADTLAYSRYVPERLDDYAYENNVVAGRVYGPALEFPRTFGSDIWVKCTDRLVIDDWFAKADYHHNYGEGMDCYKVDNTLGGGALVPYAGAENFYTGDNYTSQKHICDGPVRTEAVLEYGPLNVNGKEITATRVLTLDANSHFIKWTTTFNCADADSISVVLGAVMHDVVAKNAELNWIAFTEKASDSSDPDRDGNISVAVIYDKAELDDNPYYTSGMEAGHAVLITDEKVGKPITTWTGSGWSHAGIESQEAWAKLVKDFAYAMQHPLEVTVK